VEAPAPGAQSTPPPGAPPTFGTGAGSGPAVTVGTFAEAEKLMQVTMTAAEREQAAASWRTSMAPYLERRTGPRKVAIAATDAPGTLWNPILPRPPRHALDSDPPRHPGSLATRSLRAVDRRHPGAAGSG